jgi:ClpP class serine protease
LLDVTANPTYDDFVEKVSLVRPASHQVTLDDIAKKQFFSTAPAAGFARRQTFC